MRWGVICLRGLAPAGGVVVGGSVVLWGLSRLATAFGAFVPTTAQPIVPLWLVGAWLLVCAGLIGMFVWRLLAWERGADPCSRCGGPLGWLRPGKVYYGRQLPDYRRCLNCGDANSVA